MAPSAHAATTCPAGTSSYASTITSTSGLIGYWRLDDTSGTTACEASGAFPGTYSGGYSLGRAGAISGDPDTAAYFDGSTGAVAVPDASALDVGDTFSVEAWVKRSSTGGTENQVVASKQNNAWVLMFNPSNRLVLRQSTIGDVATSTTAVTDTSTWHHVAATKSGSSIHLYLDGQDVTGSVSNRTMANNTMPLAIGQSTDAAYLNGTIDEVALYSSVLTASQIASHWTAGGGGTTPPPPPPPTSTDPVIAAVGDIACDPNDSYYNGGSGWADRCRQLAVSQLLDNSLSAILALGDNQYEDGRLSAFNASYDSNWGQFRGITHPITGNHEYATSGASGYFDYFNGTGVASGPAGRRSSGYYSFDIGSWHLIALNSNCDEIGGCDKGSAQESWLRSDLSHTSRKCTLAYWHHPRWTSGDEGGGNATYMSTMYKDLYNANADVLLVGHDHDYERFQPLNPYAGYDKARGIREFVVGTGGKSHHAFGSIMQNSVVRDNATYGILRLQLHSSSFDWQFVPAAGGTFTDSGNAKCH